MQVAKLSADLTLNSSRFEAGLKNADRKMVQSATIWGKAFNATEGGFKILTGSVGKLTGAFGLLTSAAGAVAGAGLTIIARDALATAGALDDMANRLGTSTDELQRLMYTARQDGLGVDTLERALTKLNGKIAEGELKYKDGTEALYSIAEAVKNARDEVERASIVNEVFGEKMGSKMIPFLKNGADGLKLMGDEAERTGNVINSNTIKAADAYGDAVETLGATIKNNFQAGFLEEFTNESGDLKEVYADPEFSENIRGVGEAIGSVTAASVNALSVIGKLILKYNELDEAAQNFGKRLDQKAFDFLDRLDRKLRPVRDTLDMLADGERYGPDLPIEGIPTPKASSGLPEYESAKGLKDAEKRADIIQKTMEGLREESDLLAIQIKMYGRKESAIARAQRQLQIENQLRAQGVKLNDEQRKSISDYLDSIERQTELQSEQAEQQKELEEAEKNRRQAIQQLGATFESAFEDAIVEGKELSDVLKSLEKDLLKLQIRTNLTEPLFSAVSGGGLLESLFGGGGLSSGVMDLASEGGLFSLPSYDVGTNYVPRDQVAMVHKGEMIIPADEAGAWRNGMAGGGNVNINVHNNAGAKVSTQARDGAGGMEIDVLIDQKVSEKIQTPGSRINTALKGFNGRTMTRR